ncbi:hypothetical protein [Tenacibaculum sp. SZ-18]|nr:hypothetical protein [Tenacibaculum sp. SZ-18]
MNTEKIIHRFVFEQNSNYVDPNEGRGVFTLDSTRHFLSDDTWFLSEEK